MVNLPDAVGLCPVHGDEFYMPLWKNDTCAPNDTHCPECDETLVVYERTGVPRCPECGGEMLYSEELQTHVCSHGED